MAAALSLDLELVLAMRRAARAEAERQIAEERSNANRLRATLLPRLQGLMTVLRARGLVGRAWLFGSYAWGAPGETSDVDVLVEGSDDPFGLAAEIGAGTGLDVHVIERSRAPVELVTRIETEGIAL